MNDPRETTVLWPLLVEAFEINDDRALIEEVDALQASLAWDARTDDERTAMASLVRDALLRLAEDVEVWLPSAAVAKTNTTFGFFVWWQNRHLDDEIIRQRVNAEHESTARLRDLERIAGHDQEHP